MKTFIAQHLEVAEVELVGAGLPVTQEGAEQFARATWKGTRRARRQRKLNGCYKPRRIK